MRTAEPGRHDRDRVPGPARPLPLCRPGARVQASVAHASPAEWADTAPRQARAKGGPQPGHWARRLRQRSTCPPPPTPASPAGPGPVLPLGRGCRPPPGVATSQPPTAPQRSVCLTQGCVPEGTLPRPPPPGAGTHLGGRQVPRRGTHTAGLGPGLVSGEGREDFQEERQQEAWRKGVGAPCQGGTGRPRVRTAASTRRPPDAHRGSHRSREPRET